MLDRYKYYADSPAQPSRAPYALIPDNALPLDPLPKGIYVGIGGDVTLRGADADTDVTYRNLPDASFINVRARYVRATGTTAAGLIAEA
ncbi:MAG: hypothetical protein P8X69_11505 [Maritimibacter sp.]